MLKILYLSHTATRPRSVIFGARLTTTTEALRGVVMAERKIGNSEEVWKAVPGFEGYYEVSDRGRVKSLHRTIQRSSRSQTIRERILKPLPNIEGMLRTCLSKDGKPFWYLISRLVLTVFKGPPPPGDIHAAHWDGDPLNNRLENLRWATRSENERDKVRHGRSNRGERHGLSKLSGEQVLQIRAMRSNGALFREIAERFGVTRECISSIINRRNWRHL